MKFKKTMIPINEIENIKENEWLRLTTGDYVMYRNINKETGEAEVSYWDSSLIKFTPNHTISYSFNYELIKKIKKENPDIDINLISDTVNWVCFRRRDD